MAIIDDDAEFVRTRSGVLARMGTQMVLLARSADEIAAAQRLRYRVFYEEMTAKPSPAMQAARRDFDEYDALCDHLLVLDTDPEPDPAEGIVAGAPAVVGCYRLLRGEVAAKHGGFYSAGEYDLAPMLKAEPPGTRFLELGRSCVLAPYRSAATMQLLWRGLFVYLIQNNIDVMFGCASLAGTEPQTLKQPLAYLHHFHAMPAGRRVRALPERFVDMNLMARGGIVEADALRTLPPLIKGYVRMGASIGEGAVIDWQFSTTDVFIYLPTNRVDPRLLKHFKSKMAQEH